MTRRAIRLKDKVPLFHVGAIREAMGTKATAAILGVPGTTLSEAFTQNNGLGPAEWETTAEKYRQENPSLKAPTGAKLSMCKNPWSLQVVHTGGYTKPEPPKVPVLEDGPQDPEASLWSQESPTTPPLPQEPAQGAVVMCIVTMPDTERNARLLRAFIEGIGGTIEL